MTLLSEIEIKHKAKLSLCNCCLKILFTTATEHKDYSILKHNRRGKKKKEKFSFLWSSLQDVSFFMDASCWICMYYHVIPASTFAVPSRSQYILIVPEYEAYYLFSSYTWLIYLYEFSQLCLPIILDIRASLCLIVFTSWWASFIHVLLISFACFFVSSHDLFCCFYVLFYVIFAYMILERAKSQQGEISPY